MIDIAAFPHGDIWYHPTEDAYYLFTVFGHFESSSIQGVLLHYLSMCRGKGMHVDHDDENDIIFLALKEAEIRRENGLSDKIEI